MSKATHNLIGRTVTLDTRNSWAPMWEEWTEFFGKEGDTIYSGVIEAVHRDNQSLLSNPFYVLVRNKNGQTREFSLNHLILFAEVKS